MSPNHSSQAQGQTLNPNKQNFLDPIPGDSSLHSATLSHPNLNSINDTDRDSVVDDSKSLTHQDSISSNAQHTIGQQQNSAAYDVETETKSISSVKSSGSNQDLR